MNGVQDCELPRFGEGRNGIDREEGFPEEDKVRVKPNDGNGPPGLGEYNIRAATRDHERYIHPKAAGGWWQPQRTDPPSYTY